ncbi:hypothetical protein DFP74_6699 [Nocardiopsis sp. Huas11]|uniref:hypothetical protein n=1 Tax=Nocardiopsis sp. Huas11 TaxID=2183912 RepID=UPI000EB0CCCD|nr:hypothetical protein [Nocardiopsis sp. Huas11]RKR98978.1 hypothetical protein DFP74_6699 [Nocardiopsis sp. Huas11]
MSRRDPSRAPSLWGVPNTPDTDAPAQASDQGRAPVAMTAPPAPERAPEPPAAPAETDPAEEEVPVKVGPGLGERLGGWARASFVPPQIWSEDRPSLSKQLAYAREGLWGPKTGWHRTAAQAAFWGVSFPTSAAAYAIEWVGERPSRWVVALVLISLAYQLPYVPETVAVLIRIPAWPITATWSLLGLSA